MKNLFTGLFFLLSIFSCFGQFAQPVTWSSDLKKVSDTVYELTATATLDEGWHIYSQTAVEGPTPTEFLFYVDSDQLQLIGVNEETGVYAEYVDIWETDVYQFSDQAVFKQKVKIIDPSLEDIIVEVVSQACNDVSCLAPTPETLVFNLKGNAPDLFKATEVIDSFYENEQDPLIAKAPEASSIPRKSGDNVVKGDTELAPRSILNQVSKYKSSGEGESYWFIFITCLIAGLLTLFTPCVFPMIPMTVSFFTKQNSRKASGKFNGFLYGIFIVLIYTLFSLPFYLFESFSPDFFYEFSTNPWLNVFFFVVFVVFAISFFGAFEITLPNSLINRVDKASNIGGIIGIFFMALTLVLVSFSCTGLVIGGVLGSALSTDGGAVALTFGLFGFGIGLGIPFAIFALFPRLLDGLPKSGGWLNTVKVFLGFIELAFAFKFLSNADLVWQAGILPREIFLAIWVAIFGVLAYYLFGRVKLPHDDVSDRISVGRMVLGLSSLFFAIYLLPGMWGAPVKILSGFTPPQTYAESVYGVGYKNTSASTDEPLPENAKRIVHGIIAFDDLENGIAFAKAENKPILIDFTGWTCVNCRKMEERVWSEPEVLQLLKEEFVLVSLYLDESKPLPEDEQITSLTTGKKLRTVGNKWSAFQIDRYGVNVQPYYAIIDAEGNDLVEPVGYTPDVDEYAAWLKTAL
jgi:thiol:disulfide interchange protein DsbD